MSLDSMGRMGREWGFGGRALPQRHKELQTDLPPASSTLAPPGFPSDSLTDTLLLLASLSMALSLGPSDRPSPLRLAPEHLASLAISVASNSP